MRLTMFVVLNLMTAFSAFMWEVPASAAGFFTGDTYTSTVMTGTVQVVCRKPDNTMINSEFNCRTSSLDPVETDFFMGPFNTFADTVTLNSTLESGETRKAILPYESISGRTADKINLWVQGVGQRPLLASGTNQIIYTMTFKGSVVAQGSFSVLVKKSTSIVCQKATYQSNNTSDCESPYSMCNRYFQDMIYCMQ